MKSLNKQKTNLKIKKTTIHTLYVIMYLPQSSVFTFPILSVQQKSLCGVLWQSVSLGPYNTGG